MVVMECENKVFGKEPHLASPSQGEEPKLGTSPSLSLIRGGTGLRLEESGYVPIRIGLNLSLIRRGAAGGEVISTFSHPPIHLAVSLKLAIR